MHIHIKQRFCRFAVDTNIVHDQRNCTRVQPRLDVWRMLHAASGTDELAPYSSTSHPALCDLTPSLTCQIVGICWNQAPGFAWTDFCWYLQYIITIGRICIALSGRNKVLSLESALAVKHHTMISRIKTKSRFMLHRSSGLRSLNRTGRSLARWPGVLLRSF